MSGGGDRWVRIVVPLLLVASAGTVVAAVIIATGRVRAAQRAAADRIVPAATAPSGDPIAAEADVFRTSAVTLAIDPTPGARRAAHPRTLARYRLLRAYPGAPPRMPHGVTPEEAATGSCNTCHERGGYSARFGAYVPVTPHPELVPCLSCHVGDAPLMAVPLPGTDPSARCRQCHTFDALRRPESGLAWTPMTWPALRADSDDPSPPPIPHGRELRGNCLACHAAPAAVAEITTSHPERANCRQCHVEATVAVEGFVRPQPQLMRGGS